LGGDVETAGFRNTFLFLYIKYNFMYVREAQRGMWNMMIFIRI